MTPVTQRILYFTVWTQRDNGVLLDASVVTNVQQLNCVHGVLSATVTAIHTVQLKRAIDNMPLQLQKKPERNKTTHIIKIKIWRPLLFKPKII